MNFQINGRKNVAILALASFFTNLAEKNESVPAYNAHIDPKGNLSMTPTGGNAKVKTVGLGPISNAPKGFDKKGMKFTNVTLPSLLELGQCLTSVANRVGEKKVGEKQMINLTIGKKGITVSTTDQKGQPIKKTRVFGTLVMKKAATTPVVEPKKAKKSAKAVKPIQATRHNRSGRHQAHAHA